MPVYKYVSLQSYLYLKFQLEKYAATSKLKYYFAVDTTYVGKKLGLLLFPFTHSVSLPSIETIERIQIIQSL